MTTPESRLAKPENSRLIQDAAYTARNIGRVLGGPAPVTVEVLEAACGAANAVARQLNKLCGRIIDRTGRGAEIAKLKAENSELLAVLVEYVQWRTEKIAIPGSTLFKARTIIAKANAAGDAS